MEAAWIDELLICAKCYQRAITLGSLHKHLQEGMHRVCVCCQTSQVMQ